MHNPCGVARFNMVFCVSLYCDMFLCIFYYYYIIGIALLGASGILNFCLHPSVGWHVFGHCFCFFLFPFFFFCCFFSDVFSSGIWSSFAEMSDPSLGELAIRLKSTVLASKANGATDTYRRTFLRYASSKGEIQVFPSKAEYVVFHFQYVLDTTVYSTQSCLAVDSAIYGMMGSHFDLPQFHWHPISRIPKRLIGTRLVCNKEPISPHVITKLVEPSNLDSLLESRNAFIFLLAFAGFFQNRRSVIHKV